MRQPYTKRKPYSNVLLASSIITAHCLFGRGFSLANLWKSNHSIKVNTEKHIWKIFYRGDPEIWTPGTLRGSHGTIFLKIFSLQKLFGYMWAGLGVIMGKKWFLAQQWVFKAIIAEALKIDSYWPKNNFLPIITSNPAYIYQITSRKNFF